MMNIEVDFKWVLDTGAVVTVDAEGTYDPKDCSIWPVAMAFTTVAQVDGVGQLTLRACLAEYERIQAYAVLSLCEVARQQISESA